MTQYAAVATADIDPDSTLCQRLECSGHRAKLVRLKSTNNHFCRRAKKKTRLSTSLCVRAIKKIFLPFCLRDLNLTDQFS